MYPAAQPSTPPSAFNRGQNAPGETENVPWAGITVALAVLGLLLFMAVPMAGPTPEAVAKAKSERQAFLAVEQLRSAVLDYHGDHGVWPGQTSNSLRGLAPPVFGELALRLQLELYSDLSGATLPSPDDNHPFGPYLPNGVPTNPINGLSNIRILEEGEPFDAASERDTGWLYNPRTGTVHQVTQANRKRRARRKHVRN